jgi:putative SOS response-associated peptidase YedK
MRLSRHADVIAERYGVDSDLVLPRGLDIRPTQNVAVIRHSRSQDARRFDVQRWGLIPSWWKQDKLPAHMFNARSETAAEKPSFRTAFRRRRCLVPIDAFYEWKKNEDGTKTKHVITTTEDGPFTLAGLWETWANPGGDTIASFTILTCEPNERLATIHDRMPVILDDAVHETWLDPEMQDVDALNALMRPYPAESIVAEPSA